ncbi:hypothetical protein ACWKSP_35100 [Micromonosporaceae bacterium Da 78-11]
MTGTLGVALMLVSGCAASSATVSAATTTAPGPQVSAAPAKVVTIATPKPATAAPGVKNTGASWPAILASLSAYGQWSLANPDPANIPTIAVPGCSMANLLAEQTAGLLGSRTLVQPSPVVFSTVIGPSPASAAISEVVLTVTGSRPAEPVLDRKGKQVNTFEALPPTNLEITLNRGSDQKWRFCSVESITDVTAPEDSSVALL